MTQKPPRDGVEQTLPQPQKLHAITTKLNRQKPEKKIARANPVQTHATDFTDIISETCPSTTVLHNAERDKGNHHVLLLIGVAKVWDEPNKLWKEVEIFFDTGADQSFTSQRLADDLGLECAKQQEFLMYSFDTEKPTPAHCGTAQLELWNNDGRRHAVQLCTTPVLTGKGHTVHLGTEDREFVRQHNNTRTPRRSY
ncbi:hypothetical protein RB195_011357 [Necator americanus]|uniref:Peptidase A2 domain-containing protein n=1 Tax=Necator americanus TaxID=51031 RepID=A0ABR1D231_NECAM